MKNLYSFLIKMIILSIFFVGLSDHLFAQTPGGVSSGLSLWIKADNQVFSDLGTTEAANSNTIEQWDDQGPYGNNFTQVNPQKPTYLENSLNFNPQVYFNGTTAMDGVSMTGLPEGSGARLMRVVATQTGAFTGNHVPFSHGTAIDGQAHDIVGTSNSNRLIYGSWGAVNDVASSNFWTLNKPHIIGGAFDGISTTLLQADGVTLATANGTSPTWNTVNNNVNSRMRIGADIAVSTAEFWTGNIAEVMVYSANISAIDVQKIDSYLALKYGITMAQDYLSSDGTAIWSASDNTGYTNDIFGIGQDDSSDLNQKVSRSVNNSNGPILATTQNFTASNLDGSRTSLGEGNFILMSHNNGTENSFTASFNGGANNRSSRVYKVDETGTVGDVYFAIPYSVATFPSGGSPAIVISGDETFDNTDVVVPLTYDRTNGLYWAQINPEDGDYIALATSEILVAQPAYYRTRSDNQTDGITQYSSYEDFLAGTNGTFTLFSAQWGFGDDFFSDGIYFYRTNNVINSITRYPSIEDLGAGTNGVIFNLSQTWNVNDEFFASRDQFFRTASSGTGTNALTLYPSFADLVANTNGTLTLFNSIFDFADQFFHDGEYFLRTSTAGGQHINVNRYASLNDLVNDVIFDTQSFGPYTSNDDIFAVGITPGFTVSETALTVNEHAGTGTFTVVLDAQPSTNVVFTVTSDKTSEATVDNATLTFTSANWYTPQTVTVTGVDDDVDSNDTTAIITVAVNDASSNNLFDALEDQTVDITLIDDDTTPVLTTTAITVFNGSSAAMGGNVSVEGTSSVTERGVVYSTSDNMPTIGGAEVTKDINGTTGGGSFSKSIEGLSPVTTYYVRAYAISNAGISYGGVESFTTSVGELTWDGSESNDWHTAANWDLNVVPTSDYNVTIPAGLANYPVLSAAGVCNNLTIESSSSSSGSLIGQNNLTMNGSTTVQRYITGNAWHMVSSPAPEESISNFLSANANIPTKNVSGTDYRGMMDYNEPVNDWNTFFLNTGQTGNLSAGKGFSLRTNDTVGGTVSFTGSLSTSAVNTTVARTGDFGWNCVGNPYPSAIFINDAADADNNFIDLNTNNLDLSYTSIYVWEQTNEAYTIVALGDAAFYAQSGQAFFVKVKTDATQVQFTTAMQTHRPSAVFKSGSVVSPEIRLTATMNQKERTTRLKFNNEMSNGLDVGYDAGIFKTGFDIYTKLLEDNGIDFGLQSLPLHNIKNLEIPVGLNTKSAGEISFRISHEDFPEGVVPVLKDKLTGASFSFENESDVYTTSVSGATEGYGRFTLTFTGTTGIKNTAIQNFKAWYNDGYIYISGQMDGLGEATVYDIQGRKVAIHQLQNSTMNHVEAPAGANGIYLVKIRDAKRNEVLKVSVVGR